MKVQDTKDRGTKDQIMAPDMKAQGMRDHVTMVFLAVVQCETPTHCLTPAPSRPPAATAQPSFHRLAPRQLPRSPGCLRPSIVFRTHQSHHTTTHRRSHRNPRPEHSHKYLPCGCPYLPREHHLMSPLLTLLLDRRGVVPRCLPPISLPRAAGGLLTTLDLPPEFLSPAR